VALEPVQINWRNRRSIYTVWLRFLALTGVIAGGFILIWPSFLLSFYNPNLPWNEESRILGPGKVVTRSPSADQPKITEVLRYKAPAWEDDEARGVVNFIIYPEGAVKGVWSGEFENSGDAQCVVLASSYSGNIDPAKPCIEEHRHDADKLYFITSGTFTMLETGNATGYNRGINGLVYVRGWLDPNYLATGELFITRNKKSYEVFAWSASPIN
jgi:hypothetical protein